MSQAKEIQLNEECRECRRLNAVPDGVSLHSPEYQSRQVCAICYRREVLLSEEKARAARLAQYPVVPGILLEEARLQRPDGVKVTPIDRQGVRLEVLKPKGLLPLKRFLSVSVSVTGSEIVATMYSAQEGSRNSFEEIIRYPSEPVFAREAIRLAYGALAATR